MSGASAIPFVDAKLLQRKVLMFSKTYSPECKQIKALLSDYKMSSQDFEIIEIEKRQDCSQIEDYFQTLCLTDSRAVPQLFVKGVYIGGEKEIPRKHESGELKTVFTNAEVEINMKAGVATES